jgi:hypothetical protein
MPGLARDESIAYAIAPSTRPSLAAPAGCFQQPAGGPCSGHDWNIGLTDKKADNYGLIYQLN